MTMDHAGSTFGIQLESYSVLPKEVNKQNGPELWQDVYRVFPDTK
jgi:hypothetical protein